MQSDSYIEILYIYKSWVRVYMLQKFPARMANVIEKGRNSLFCLI